MNTEAHKKRKHFSKNLRTEIQTKPHTQPINNKDYTYGLLQKKSGSSFFSNQRFLLIKGAETFGYASSLPDKVELPFQSQDKFPKLKSEQPLENLDISHEKQILAIEFKQKGKKEPTKWEFKCKNKTKALEWRRVLEAAKTQKMSNLQNSAQKIILEDPAQQYQDESEAKPVQKKPQLQKTNQVNHEQKRSQNQMLRIEKDNVMQSNQKIQHQANQSIEKNSRQLQEKQGQQGKQGSLNQKEQNSNVFGNLLSGYQLNQTGDKGANKNKKGNQKRVIENAQQSVSNEQKQASESLSALLIKKQQGKGQDKDNAQKAREEFLHKKREQGKLQSGSGQNMQSGMSELLLGLNDPKFHMQQLRRNWGFEFAKAEEQQEVVESFRIYVETVVVKIVDELALDIHKRYFAPAEESESSLRYQIEDLSLELFLNQLADVAPSTQRQKVKVFGNESVKAAYQELKNYNYILSLTHNRGRIRVPLAMCVEYKGFVALAKTIIPEAQSYTNMESLQRQLEGLQAESRIHNSVFENSDHGRLVPLLTQTYERLSRAQNQPRRFDICYTEGLRHYLPQDFYWGGSEARLLRKELVQDQEYEEQTFYGDNMADVETRLKVPQYVKDAVDSLIQASKSISTRVNALVTALENLDQVVTNSRDLSDLLHGYGINVRYLGLVLERASAQWLKRVVMADIAARCAKYLLRFDIQQYILNMRQTRPENVRKFQAKQVISFFNKLLGNSQETDVFWDQLSMQAQHYFHCYLDRTALNIGFLLQSAQKHCRVWLVDIPHEQEVFFKQSAPFDTHNFGGFEVKSKTYDLGFTELYRRVNGHLRELTQDSYEQLSALLSVRKGSLSRHFSLNGFSEKIVLFLINWLSPEKGHSIYYPSEIQLSETQPSKSLYQIKLTEIKWLLKDNQESESQRVRDWLIEHITRWLGVHHPLLTDLYEIYSQYYLTDRHMEMKTVNYCKSSIKNLQKLLGCHHVKMADSYYTLATVYLNYNRNSEALSNLRRAKEILERANSDEKEADGLISLKIGQLLLASDQLKEALNYAIQAYTQLVDTESLDSYIQCVELVSRCYQVEHDWDNYTRFTTQLFPKLVLFTEDPLLLERVTKVIVSPYFHQLATSSQISRRLLSIFQAFPRTNYSNNPAYSYIKENIKNKSRSFPVQFIDQLENVQDLLAEIENNGIMTRWKGFENVLMDKSLLSKLSNVGSVKSFQMLATLQALNIFLGEGFLQCILVGL